MTSPSRGLLDSSVLIVSESGRELQADLLPEETLVSVITIAELHAGVLAARDTATRARRLATVEALADLEPLSVDSAAARAWASLRVRLAEVGRRVNVNDLWIAAIAVANDLPVVTQDSDYDPLESIGGPTVIRI